MESTQKTKQQIKAEKRAARAKQAELDRKYYNPPTERYKRLRRLWWTLLIVAIVALLLSWILQRTMGNSLITYILLGGSYVCIIVALYVELSRIRKVRREYQAQMEAHKSKAVRAAEKEAKAQQRSAATAKAAGQNSEPAAASQTATTQKKRFSLFGNKNAAAADAAGAEAGEASEASASGDNNDNK